MGWKKGQSLSKEHRQKISQALIGHKTSKATRHKIGLANKGNIPWNKGKRLTKEDKKKKSEAMKKWASTPAGRKHLKNINNLSHMPKAEEKRSKSISKRNLERYAKNPELGKKITKKAHEKTRQMIDEGMHPFQDPKIRIKAQKALFKKNYGGTWIEKKIGWLLNQMGLEYISQKPIPYGFDSLGRSKHLFPDFVLSEYDLIIECDGEYWHKNKQRQKERDQVFKKQGYKVLHLLGSKIRENIEDCRKEIEFSLKH